MAYQKPLIDGNFYYYKIIKLLQSYNKNTLTCQNKVSAVFQCLPDSGSLKLCRSFLWCGKSNEIGESMQNVPLKGPDFRKILSNWTSISKFCISFRSANYYNLSALKAKLLFYSYSIFLASSILSDRQQAPCLLMNVWIN